MANSTSVSVFPVSVATSRMLVRRLLSRAIFSEFPPETRKTPALIRLSSPIAIDEMNSPKLIPTNPICSVFNSALLPAQSTTCHTSITDVWYISNHSSGVRLETLAFIDGGMRLEWNGKYRIKQAIPRLTKALVSSLQGITLLSPHPWSKIASAPLYPSRGRKYSPWAVLYSL